LDHKVVAEFYFAFVVLQVLLRYNNIFIQQGFQFERLEEVLVPLLVGELGPLEDREDLKYLNANEFLPVHTLQLPRSIPLL
jgi:hypothetical protein